MPEMLTTIISLHGHAFLKCSKVVGAFPGGISASAGAKLHSNHLGFQVGLESGTDSMEASRVKLQASVPDGMWYVLIPLLRQHIERAQGT